ncbi:MAG: MFS transporter [Clostridia bacterium]|nr:MFS transporter [Clostridia bacterium]MBR6666929.1 MFS transporter [Clostridia bacterium]
MQRKLWNKDFILLLQGNAISDIGDLLYSVAIGYWVYEKTGSSALMGVMTSIAMFVTMFLSPFAGSIVDKLSRRFVIVGMDSLRGLIMLALGVLAWTDSLSVPVVLLAAFAASLCSVFFNPAVNTLMIDLIPHDDMVRGQSVFSASNALINLVGKAFSGVLVAFLGVPLIVVLNGASYLISAVSEMFIRVPRTVQQGEKVSVKGVLADFGKAMKAIFSDRCLKLFIPFALLLNLLAAGPLSLMLPFCMEKGFTMDMYGYLLSVEVAGSLLCVLLLGIFKLKPRTRFALMAIGFIGSQALCVLAFLMTDFLPMAVLLFLSALLNAAGNSIFNAALMLALPEENRGAILGFIEAASVGGCALSAVIYGLLGEIFPLYLVFAVGSLISLPFALYLFSHRETKDFILTH